MKRHLYDAQYKLNPGSTELLPEEFHSGDTLHPEWDAPRAGYKKGSVQEGVSMTEPLYADTPQINKSKRS